MRPSQTLFVRAHLHVGCSSCLPEEWMALLLFCITIMRAPTMPSPDSRDAGGAPSRVSVTCRRTREDSFLLQTFQGRSNCDSQDYISELLPQADLIQQSSSAVSPSEGWRDGRRQATGGERRGRRRWDIGRLGRWRWRGRRRGRWWASSTTTTTSAGRRRDRRRWETHGARLAGRRQGRTLAVGGGRDVGGGRWGWQRRVRRRQRKGASVCRRRRGRQASTRRRWLSGQAASLWLAWDRREGARAASRRRRSWSGVAGSRHGRQRPLSARWRWWRPRSCNKTSKRALVTGEQPVQ